MSLAVWQRTIVDNAGNVLPGASVEVRDEVSGNLANLKSNRAGSSGKSNPFAADADGFAQFYVLGGAYRIVVTSGALTMTWRHVAIGTAAETDAPAGLTRVHTAAGDATVEESDVSLVIRKTVSEATSVILPPAAARAGRDVLIKDGKGDAADYPITPVFSGSESCDGVSHDTSPALQITTPYGHIWMRPYPDGSGYFMLPSQL